MAELAAFADVLRKFDCWIVCDEIYSKLVYDDFEQRSILQVAPDLKDRVVEGRAGGDAVAIRVRVATLELAMCGTIRQLSSVSSGDSIGIGSGSVTSSAA